MMKKSKSETNRKPDSGLAISPEQLRGKRLAQIQALGDVPREWRGLSLLRNVEDFSEEEFRNQLASWKEASEISRGERGKAEDRAKLGMKPPVENEPHPDEEKGVFIQGIDPDGKPAWRPSAALRRRYEELRNYSKIKDPEIAPAAEALLLAELRLLNNKDGDAEDFEERPVTPEEAGPAYTGFLLPLAKRLTALRKAENWSVDRRLEIKEEAEAWFKTVIENAFCDFLIDTDTPTIRAVEVIHLAWKFCEEKNSPPFPGEFYEYARKSDKKRWGEERTVYDALKLAGLKLKKKPRGADKTTRKPRGKTPANKVNC